MRALADSPCGRRLTALDLRGCVGAAELLEPLPSFADDEAFCPRADVPASAYSRKLFSASLEDAAADRLCCPRGILQQYFPRVVETVLHS